MTLPTIYISDASVVSLRCTRVTRNYRVENIIFSRRVTEVLTFTNSQCDERSMETLTNMLNGRIEKLLIVCGLLLQQLSVARKAFVNAGSSVELR